MARRSRHPPEAAAAPVGPEVPPGLRERKKLRTRVAIEDAALALFAERGFEATTVEEIAAAADISPRTFFHYFASKEGVVLADYASRLDRIVEVLASRPEGEGPLAAVRAAFLTVAADYEAQRERLLPRFAVMATSPSVQARSLHLQSGWEDEVARVLAERLGVDADADPRPRLIAGSALAAMRSSLRRWLATGGHDDLPALVADCFDLLAAGLDNTTGGVGRAPASRAREARRTGR